VKSWTTGRVLLIRWPIEGMKKQTFGSFRRAAALSSGLVMTCGLGGCSLMHLPQMPWSHSQAKTTASPYAPVAIGPPIPPAPPVDTAQYGTQIDQVVASVDGSPITDYDLQNPNAASGGMNTLSGNLSGVNRDEVLKQLIAQQLLDEEAQKFADKVDDADVDRYIQSMEQRNNMTDAQLRAQLQAQGISYDEFRKSMFKQVEALTMIEHEVREKIQIPDSAVETYYKEHPDEFRVTDEKYDLAQILIAVPISAPPDKVAQARTKAEKVRAMAVQGHEFGDLARQYSDDDSKNKGGELGQFNPSDLNDQIAAAVKQTKTGDIAPLIQTKYGFHIIKVEAHQVPGEQPLTAVKDQIRDKLTTEEAKTRFDQWVEQDLAKQHDVETTD
jgi:peptidyl-prolyl cis-trans isomerase SurA